jgi:metallo-beta-lactamase family protein
MKITSYGAAGEVTGTKHLLEVNGYRILLDCGMFQGHREEADGKNRHLGLRAVGTACGHPEPCAHRP